MAETGIDNSAQRRVIVTGGATNIGRAITTRFLEAGARVVAGQPDISAVEPFEGPHAENVALLQYDQGVAGSCEQFMAAAVESLGGLDVLVNNAAISGLGSSCSFWDLDPAYVSRMLDVNLKGVILCSLGGAKAMRDAGGVIINISSINAFKPQAMASVYAAAKAAVGNLTQSMAKELGASGIRVVAVAPGDIWTDTYDDLIAEMTARGDDKEIVGQAVLGQGQPIDIAEAVYFLASDKARYITGTTLTVDGGLLA